MLYSRRTFLKIASGLAATFCSGAFAKSNPSTTPYTDKVAADKWINEWMLSPHAVAGTLHLGRFADPMYFLTKEINWTPNPGQHAPSIRVPEGFVTDFASIPRIFWSVLPVDGLYTFPAIIHDYLYWEQSVSREMADLIFRYAMEDFKINPVTIATIHAGVRLGGGGAWDENKTLKQAGEKRVLRRVPTDPTVRWNEWKKRPNVFN